MSHLLLFVGFVPNLAQGKAAPASSPALHVPGSLLLMQKLLPVIQQKTQPWTRVITHRLGLSQGVQGYKLFDEKLDGCIKVVLDCSR